MAISLQAQFVLHSSFHPSSSSSFCPLLASRLMQSPFALPQGVRFICSHRSLVLTPQLPPLLPRATLSQEVAVEDEVKQWSETIRDKLRSIEDGHVSVSAYDTAWVAMVPALDGAQKPQYPKCLQWITTNQHTDGSWGSAHVFLPADRLLSTLACVLALQTWNAGHSNIQRGVQFIAANMDELISEANICLPCGFPIIFPLLLDNARNMGLHLPYDSPVATHFQMERQRHLRRIKCDSENGFQVKAKLPYLVEGLEEHANSDILKLQEENGSICHSPASTAYAFIRTRDMKCLDYLNKVLQIFDNAVPTMYPVDLLERICILDRIQRLGISHLFQSEMEALLHYVYRHWTQDGLGWASGSSIKDLDATSMAFRLLRLNGYKVSADAFNRFRRSDGTFCDLLQYEDSPPVSTMYNLFRASTTSFPGETVLEEAKEFSSNFLSEKQQNNQMWDSKVLVKDLPGEIGYALQYPWHATLQRLEARQYLEHYGVNDVGVGKALYKLPNVSNLTLLKLAKADFNLCQAMHQRELQQLTRWNEECQFQKVTFARQRTTEIFFGVAATSFEPELAAARLAWAKAGVLVTVLDDFFDVGGNFYELQLILEAVKCWEPAVLKDCSEQVQLLFLGLYNTINDIAQEASLAQGRDISSHLRKNWVETISAHLKEAEWSRRTSSGYFPTLQEYIEVGMVSIATEAALLPALFFVGPKVSEEMISHDDYKRINCLVSAIVRLQNDIQGFQRESSQGKPSSVVIYLRENPGATESEAINYVKQMIDEKIKILLMELLTKTEMPREWKDLCWNMIKVTSLFFLKADGLSSLTEMAGHVQRVLFKPVS